MRRAGLCGKWKGPGADSEEKHEPVSDIDIAVADGLKVLDLKRPIREADMINRGHAGGRGSGEGFASADASLS